ncbi:anthranilate synthase component I family protein [Bacteroidota bacterium]
MSFAERNKIKTTKKEVDSLIQSSSTAIWLRNIGGQNKEQHYSFSSLYGIGVHSEFILGLTGSVSDLKAWLSNCNDYVFGYLGYDLKNELERLTSQGVDSIGFCNAYFFVPETVVVVGLDGNYECFSHGTEIKISNAKNALLGSHLGEFDSMSKSAYLAAVGSLKEHMQQGNVYEVNYCVENKFKDASIDPFSTFLNLQKVSPAPFSCYVAHEGKYLMSSSPERFMKKVGERLISQPMKGTNRRVEENDLQQQRLRLNKKEVAENVMITDLVRNDLSKSAKQGTVKVDELCGVYAFEHVNQLISTVSCEMRKDVHPLDAMLEAFPMGSMTGAPKVRAMQLIEEHEVFSRGLYSGTVGYFTPEMDFDFNVVIRSILYNEEQKIVTFPTGGAITINSNLEAEYEECVLKAEAMKKALTNDAE